MKQYITVDDLNTLTSSQKQALNFYWLPAKYDHVVASVCKDAENDVYEDVEFVVGDIILHGTNITLRRLMLMDDIMPDENEALENDQSNDEGEPFFDVPADFFPKENCLPLLNIGQLIELLRQTKGGQSGFSIDIPPSNEKFFEQSFILSDKYDEVDKSEELTDLLFNILKEYL